MNVQYAEVAPGYLRTLQIPLIAGRAFSWSDTDNSQLVTIVSQQFANRYWPGQDAIGKRLQVGGGQWFTVVGIAPDSNYDSLGEKPKSFFYLPLTQAYYASVTLEARTFGNPLLLARSVEQTVHSLDADVALYDLTTLDSRIKLATSTQRDRKSTRLNSSHTVISYAVFCLKKKKMKRNRTIGRKLWDCADHELQRRLDLRSRRTVEEKIRESEQDIEHDVMCGIWPQV